MPYIAGRNVVERYSENPIITLEELPFACNTVFNTAAAKYGDKYMLLVRVENLVGRSVFALALSEDGYTFKVEPNFVMTPSNVEPYKTYESLGIEDPRITYMDGVFYIMYTAYSQHGARLALAKTTDFRNYERIALISEPNNKNGVLFPKKINGRFARLDRPFSGSYGSIWISYSDDLIAWYDSEVVMTPRHGYWDSDRIGAGVPPIELDYGWLEIYHGVKNTSFGPIYRMGAVILDLENPAIVVARSAVPILSPRELYERVGDVGNVVFACGAIPEDDGTIKLYYGAADTSICVGTAKITDIIDTCLFERDIHQF
ncbi:MAG: glycoside hydrolase family 130 protein [Armatimonadota bacterium]